SPHRLYLLVFVFQRCSHPLNLHSFPTRRSSDLFGKSPKTRHVDGGVVNEHVGSTVSRDEPVALLRVKPLDRADRHGVLLKKAMQDRKSTRLNSSHVKISYAVFCLKKKKQTSTKT